VFGYTLQTFTSYDIAAMQHPATGPKLGLAIQRALQALDEYRTDCGFSSWDACGDQDALLWRILLIRSLAECERGVATLFRRQDIGIPARIALTGRRWDQFQRWHARKVLNRHLEACKPDGLPMLYGGRMSDSRGGHAESAEALYFVSYDPPEVGPAPTGATALPDRVDVHPPSLSPDTVRIVLSFASGALCALLLTR
jgi:hypothetical protein